MPYKDKEQQRAAQRMWAQKNKIVVKERIEQKRNRLRKFIHEYKVNNSVCVDCNISYPPHVLDFDHLGDKDFGIADATRKATNIDNLIKEIEKCEIVCANCHRHRTWIRQQVEYC